MKVKKDELEVFRPGRVGRLQKVLWDLFEKPHTSIGARVWHLFIHQQIRLNIMLQMSMHTKIFIVIFHLDRGHYFNYIHHTIHRCVDAEHSALFLTQRWWKYWQRLSTICFAGSHLYVLVYLWIFSKYPYIAICSFSDFVSF